MLPQVTPADAPSLTLRAALPEGTPMPVALAVAGAWQAFCDSRTASLGRVWQHEAMEWCVAPAAAGAPPCLLCTLAYGASVEDEWYATYLALQLTGGAADVGLVGDPAALAASRAAAVQAWDAEAGDYLLAEGAEHLPAWLSPEDMAHRVLLWRGALHVLPPPRLARHWQRAGGAPLPGLAHAPSLAQAAQHLRATPQQHTLAPLALRAALEARVAPFARASHCRPHTARVRLPLAAAHLLHRDPSLVAAAVDAFLTRGEGELVRAGGLLAAGGPAPALHALSLPLTRIHYAQLLHSRLAAPAKGPFAPQPPPQGAGAPQAAQDAKELSLGQKLCVGLEVLLLRACEGSRDCAALRGRLLHRASTAAAWHAALLAAQQPCPAAAQAARPSPRLAAPGAQEGLPPRHPPTLRCLALALGETLEDAAPLPQAPWPPHCSVDDSDAWLGEGEGEGQGQGGGGEGEGEGKEEEVGLEDMRKLLASLEKFIETESGAEGVEDEEGEGGGDTEEEMEEEEEWEEERGVESPAPASAASRPPFPTLTPALFQELIELAQSGSTAPFSPALEAGLRGAGLLARGGPLFPASEEGDGEGQGGASQEQEDTFPELGAVMEAMDAQLKELMLTAEEEGERPASSTAQEAEDMYRLVQGAAQSVRAQGGQAGPASTLLHSLGVAVPKEWWGKGQAE